MKQGTNQIFPISPTALPTKINKETVSSLYFRIGETTDD